MLDPTPSLRKSSYWLKTPHHEWIIPKFRTPDEISNSNLQLPLVLSPFSPGTTGGHFTSELEVESDTASLKNHSDRSVIGSPIASPEDLDNQLEFIRGTIDKLQCAVIRSTLQLQMKFITELILKNRVDMTSSRRARHRNKHKFLDDDWRMLLQSQILVVDHLLDMETQLAVQSEHTLKNAREQPPPAPQLQQNHEETEEPTQSLWNFLPPQVYRLPFRRLQSQGLTSQTPATKSSSSSESARGCGRVVRSSQRPAPVSACRAEHC